MLAFGTQAQAQFSSYKATLNDLPIIVDSVSAEFTPPAKDSDDPPLRTFVFHLHEAGDIYVFEESGVDGKGATEFLGMESEAPPEEVPEPGVIVYYDAEEEVFSTSAYPAGRSSAKLMVTNAAEGGLDGKAVIFVSGQVQGKLITDPDLFGMGDEAPEEIEFKLTFNNVPIQLPQKTAKK